MKITIGMIVLNEEEFIECNLRQHYDLADEIIIVEGADRFYPSKFVSEEGLSTDRTANIIRNFPDPSNKIRFIQHGWVIQRGVQAKCELRNRYADLTQPGILCVLDADEFYTPEDFAEVIERTIKNPNEMAWRYPFYHFWHNTDQFITGGYYDTGHTRFWRWSEGMRYKQNHNWPEFNGQFLWEKKHFKSDRDIIPLEDKFIIRGPVTYHLGFARSAQNIRSKTDYYRNRGEVKTHLKTIKSRESWFTDKLSSEFALFPFGGNLPKELQKRSLIHA